MLVKISEVCGNCNCQDRGNIIDVAMNPLSEEAAYYDCDGIMWHLYSGDFEPLNIYKSAETIGQSF